MVNTLYDLVSVDSDAEQSRANKSASSVVVP